MVAERPIIRHGAAILPLGTHKMSSIPLPALGVRPPEQQPGPLDQYAKLLSLRQLQAQGQTQQLQQQAMAQENQLRSQQIKDSQIYMDALQKSGGDFDKALDTAAKNGMSGIGYQQAYSMNIQRKEAVAKLSETELNAQKQTFDLADGLIQGYRKLSAEQQAAQWPQVAEQIKKIAPQAGNMLPQQPPDENWLNMAESFLLGGKTTIDKSLNERKAAAEEWKTQPETGNIVNTRTKEVIGPPEGTMSGAMADSRYRNIVMNQQLGKPISQEDQAFLGAYKKQKTLVPQFNFNLQTQGVGNTPLNPKQEATVQAILDGRMTPPSSFALKTPYWQNIMGAVFEKDPQFSEQRAQLRKGYTVGPQSKEINAINTAMGHVGVLGDSIDALNNGDVRALNAVANRVGVEIGKDPVTTFNTIVHRVGPEISRAYVGAGGGEAERGTTEKDFDPNLGPQQLRSNVAITARLLRSKIASLENQWNQNAPEGQDFQSRFIMPEAQRQLDKWAPQKQGGGGGGGVQVTDPRGHIHTFPDQKSADAFKAAAGIK